MLETIKLWWAATTAKWANNRLIRIQHQLKRDSTSAINLMEFNGDVYISYNGTPVVSTEFINLQSVEVLEAARKTWIDYRLSEMDIENKTA